MIKIRLPSPKDLSQEDWFEQMELCLFHAKKAYEKFKKGLEQDAQKDISLYFSFPGLDRNEKYSEMTLNEEIPYEDTQEVEIVIDY